MGAPLARAAALDGCEAWARPSHDSVRTCSEFVHLAPRPARVEFVATDGRIDRVFVRIDLGASRPAAQRSFECIIDRLAARHGRQLVTYARLATRSDDLFEHVEWTLDLVRHTKFSAGTGFLLAPDDDFLLGGLLRRGHDGGWIVEVTFGPGGSASATPVLP
jgi:hypothetical protein